MICISILCSFTKREEWCLTQTVPCTYLQIQNKHIHIPPAPISLTPNTYTHTHCASHSAVSLFSNLENWTPCVIGDMQKFSFFPPASLHPVQTLTVTLMMAHWNSQANQLTVSQH